MGSLLSMTLALPSVYYEDVDLGGCFILYVYN